MNISFVVEHKPLSVNAMYTPIRWGKGHGVMKTVEGREYQKAVRIAAIIAGVRKQRIASGPVLARLAFFWPTEAGDVDGPVKPTLDALQGLTYVNDRQVKRLVVHREKDPARPRVEVHIEDLPSAQLSLDDPWPWQGPAPLPAGKDLEKGPA